MIYYVLINRFAVILVKTKLITQMNFLTKHFYCVALMVLVSASGGFAQAKKSSGPVKKAAKTITVPAAELEAGKALIQKSDCAACHKTDMKLVGPAFIDIAKKYPASEANYILLSSKVIKGGSGVWGQVPMAGHPSVSPPDAKKMVKYILSLN